MSKELVQIGDKVTLQVAKDNRDWGYNPGPDGTELEVVGWSPYYQTRFLSYNSKPGIYNNRCWPIVKFPDGSTNSISYHHLVSKEGKTFDIIGRREEDYLGPLPETEFYEWDEVYCHNRPEFKYVTFINYKWVNDETYFQVSTTPSAGCSTHLKASELKLVRRGAVYKYYNDLPLEIEGNEEFKLFYKLGHYQEIRNPVDGLYRWNKKEVEQAARDGIVDCPVTAIVDSTWNSAIKFNDRKLGERARNYYLRNIE